MRVVAILINLVPYHIARWRAVAESGHEVTILQWRANDPFKILEASSESLPFSLVTLPESARKGRALLKAVRSELRRIDSEIVFVSGWRFPISLAGILAADGRVPVVVCSESNKWDASRNPVVEKIKSRVVGLCAAGFAGGKPQRDYLLELGMPPQSVFTGYNAVDNGHFAKGVAGPRFQAMGRFLLSVARFTPKKNLVGLVEGFTEFAKRNPQSPLNLVIAGEGPLRVDLEAAIQSNGLAGRVFLLGAVGYDELPSLYAAAGGLIHASLTEQWGLVVNEAMAAGLPVLVSERCGCASELVVDGENGRIFDPASRASLAAAIEWFDGRSENDLERISSASRHRIADFGPAAFAIGAGNAMQAALKRGAVRIGLLDFLLLRGLAGIYK